MKTNCTFPTAQDFDNAEHVHMETGFFGCPNTLIVANSTRDEYSETFIDVPTAQVYPSRDHAQAGRL